MQAVECTGQDGLAAKSQCGLTACPSRSATIGCRTRVGAGPAQAAVQGPSLLLLPAHVPAAIEEREQRAGVGECSVTISAAFHSPLSTRPHLTAGGRGGWGTCLANGLVSISPASVMRTGTCH